ncbi:hypothetical protein [uncultured Aquimarina sp.]|uniref:helix-turn-helix transcriptional regulator n=1 Tax=uncultured Aquimarina sp. TaxID=575652 RepID=UPI00260E5A39|nr:hypothetical protein [uncultured Aquimarina sp.]
MKEHNYEQGRIHSYYYYSDYFMSLKKYDSARYYLDKTYSIIQKKRNYKKLKKIVLTNKATINAKNGLYTRALFLYRKAYKIAINNKMQDTLLLKLNIFNMFNELGKEGKTIERLIKLKNKFTNDTIKNWLITFNYFETLANAYERKKDLKNALKIWKKNTSVANDHKNKRLEAYSLLKISNLFLLSDSLSKAEATINKFSETINRPFNDEILSLFYETNGLLNLKLNKLYVSNKYFDSITKIPKTNKKALMRAYKYKYDNYHILEMHKEANVAIKSYIEIRDHLRNITDKDILNYYNSDFRFIRERKEKNTLKLRNQKQNSRIIILSLIVLCTCLGFITTLILKKYNKNKITVKKLKANEKKNYEDQLKKREEELIATATSVQDQNKKIKHVQSKLNLIMNNKNYHQLVEVKKELNDLLNSSNGINLIYDKLESRYPNLAIVLKDNYPQLTANDIKHCLLLKLNLSIKDCSQLLSVSSHAIKMARKRIKKKMELPEETRLKEFLETI